MKWKDLSLKERKQIYDSVRVNNPDATYFDIKEQFDSIPTYEDGKGKTINKADLPPEYRTGTPEYFERQRKISGAVNAVQPEAYITPARYIKDAVDFIEDLGKGDYAGAAIDAALNLIPWGVGETIKKIKKNVGRAIEGIDAYTAESYAEPFTPTITKEKGKKVKTEADYDQEFAEVKRKHNNMQEYEKELSKITNDLFVFNDGSVETLEKVDKAYGTNYKKAASAIAFQDMANRGKYVKHQQMYDSAGNPIYGRTTGKVDQPTIENMTISLNPDYYLEGTANHEISHLADALVNKVHSADATNNYMEYLLDRDNIMSYYDIRPDKQGFINRMNNLTPIEWAVPLELPVFFGEGQKKQIINMKELEGVYPLYPVPSYKKGGIHIKKSKRGTFKAAAKKAGMGVQEYANKVLKKGSKASPAMKKKANFARNAAKWKH